MKSHDHEAYVRAAYEEGVRIFETAGSARKSSFVLKFYLSIGVVVLFWLFFYVPLFRYYFGYFGYSIYLFRYCVILLLFAILVFRYYWVFQDPVILSRAVLSFKRPSRGLTHSN